MIAPGQGGEVGADRREELGGLHKRWPARCQGGRKRGGFLVRLAQPYHPVNHLC